MARKQSAPRLEFEAAAIWRISRNIFARWLEALPGSRRASISFTATATRCRSISVRASTSAAGCYPTCALLKRPRCCVSRGVSPGSAPLASWGALPLEARSMKEQQPLLTSGYGVTSSSAPGYLRTTGRRLSMPVRLISRTSSISMGLSRQPAGGAADAAEPR